jgi:hypothetical protein
LTENVSRKVLLLRIPNKSEGKVGMLKEAPLPEGLWGNRSTIFIHFFLKI